MAPRIAEGYPTDHLLALTNLQIESAFNDEDLYCRAVYFQHLLKSKWQRLAVLQGADI